MMVPNRQIIIKVRLFSHYDSVHANGQACIKRPCQWGQTGNLRYP